jgi:hypothetical protein
MIENTKKLLDASDEKERVALEEQNDRLVYQLFDLTDLEVEELLSSPAFHSTSSSGDQPGPCVKMRFL